MGENAAGSFVTLKIRLMVNVYMDNCGHPEIYNCILD